MSIVGRDPAGNSMETAAAPPRVTVLTATYQRAGTLPRLYRSLTEQTFRDFEWLVVDDGSTDGTKELVDGWARASPFPIRYFWKPNGGKHTAHNFALSLIRGTYCAIIDSDDWYLPTGLADLVEAWASIPPEEVSRFASVEGLAQRPSGELLGPPLPTDVLDADPVTVTRLRKGHADTRGMHRSEVLREFPFPEGFDGQLVPEAVVWMRMGRKYRSRYVNKVVGGAEYLAGGLSDLDVTKMLASVGPRLLRLKEELQASSADSFATRAKVCANYLRLSFHEGRFVERLADVPSPLLGLAVLPVSFGLYLRDLIRQAALAHHRG